MAINNNTILASAWLNGTNDYQQRVPRVSEVGVRGVQEFLYAPMNRAYLNQFANFLVNRIGGHYIRQKRFENPLAFLKNEQLPYGQTVEETAFKWVKAHSFNSDDMTTETLLKTHYPDGVSAFHSVNRKDVYEISYNNADLKMAFTSETGLNDFVSAILDVPINSDNYDEYQIMKQLFAEFDNAHGMFRVKIDAVNDEATAKAALRKLREYAELLRFPTTLYNAQDVNDVPVFVADAEDLILFTTPRVRAALDVEALAALFNIEYGQVPYRVCVLDELPMPNVEAILTTRDFFMVNDSEYDTRMFDNPHSLTTNYYLHHWGIYSVSPFVPVIAFTTEDTVVPVIEMKPTGLELSAPETIYLNDKRSAPALVTSLIGTVNGEDGVCFSETGVNPDSAIITVESVKDSKGAEIAFTEEQVQIFANGELYVAAHGNSKLAKAVKAGGVTLTLKATSTYLNPSGETKEFTATKEVAVKCREEEEGD